MQATRIGKYRLIAQLGQGGMAAVFLSVVPGPGGVNKLLVIKLLNEELAGDPEFLSMFLNEARLAARLNHANVVHTYEVGVDGGRHFLAMDYLDGQPLHAVTRKASQAGVPLDIHLRILADALAGLHYAHTLRDFDGTPLRVVHRDVSPQNVFITYEGHVKLVDFGIAKAVGASSNTQNGVFKGKLSYVAPEQAGGEVVDARADVFSVGIMLWEAIARRRFAQGDDLTSMLGRRLLGNEPRIRQVVPDVDPELADICDRAMAQHPEDRYNSARELHEALELFLDRFSRRVGPREVGQFVAELFSEEREHIRQVIEEQMKLLARETASALPLATLGTMASTRDSMAATVVENWASSVRSGSRESGSTPVLPSVPSVYEGGTGSTTRKREMWMAGSNTQSPRSIGRVGNGILLGLAMVALGLLGGIVLVAYLKSPSSTPKAAVSVEVPSPGIKLSITFGPPGAIAKLDGAPLATSPFEAQVPRDRSLHRIDVEGAGLQPETRMVSYDRDIVITLSLKAAEAPSAAPAPSSGGSVVPSLGPSVAPTAKRPSSGTAPRPKAPRRGGEIDEKDPYQP